MPSSRLAFSNYSMASRYGSLSRAQLSIEYLHTNSTTHEFLFGALAELVDNSRDAQATKINIYTVRDDTLRGGRILCFLDDGDGMDPDEAADIIKFGNSSKRAAETNLIGQYGNGLKSGSMRIGKDLILFTKRDSTMTCLFLSRTFHDKERLKEVIVPLPSWDTRTQRPLVRTPAEEERRQLEINLILRHSPFHTEKDLLDQFNAIDSPSGTLVMIYMLKLLDSGQPELDLVSDPTDIRLSDESDDVERLPIERRSFRAYTSILYNNPKMKIYIQGSKVASRRLQHCLYKPRMYQFTSKRFKTRSEQDAAKAEQQAKLAEEKAREMEDAARLAQASLSTLSDKDGRVAVRQAQTAASNARNEADLLNKIWQSKQKALKHPKTLSFTFGFNLNNRGQDGMFVYNCSRLIKMYDRGAALLEGDSQYRGIVGVVDIPYVVLEPTHNKQDFADAKEYRHLLKALSDHLCQYWKDSGIESQGVQKFWESFGYSASTQWDVSPSDDPKFVRKRAMQIPREVQCDKCLKWRSVPFSVKNIGKEFPSDWTCSINTDSAHNTCGAGEQKVNIPIGTLQKSTKSDAEKKADIVEHIEKQQKRLDELEKRNRLLMQEQPVLQSTVRGTTSSREALAAAVSSKQTGSVLSQAAASLMSVKQQTKKKVKTLRPPITVEIDQNDVDKEEVAVVSSPLPPPPKKIQAEAQTTKEDVVPSSRKRGRPRKRRLSPSDSEEKELDEGVGNGDIAFIDSVDTKVDTVRNKGWLTGQVHKVDSRQLCLQLDRHSSLRQDKWEARGNHDSSQQKHVPDSPSVETPSTTTGLLEQKRNSDGLVESNSHIGDVTSASASLQADKIAKLLRDCLQYFLPPDWVMKKEQIDSLSSSELADFPLDGFVKHYEQGVTKLISGFQAQAEVAKRQARETEEKLFKLRRSVGQLIRSMSTDYPLLPDDQSENVDGLLCAILSKQ
ncbi:ATPase MORC2A-like isoform X2 [Corticium candelabrum]|uniref:ATPase MORC2A-like isoform X2 n=1 Tax=Corticium candelabrum TaxID=121492 RepID=UPI002E25D4C2|nr:ATPase MORC2A-like isoform X2 [Corticium candelabrum]